MRVVHVAPSFARRDGGPSETLRGLLPELAKIGTRITVIATDKGTEEHDLEFAAKHKISISRAIQPLSWTFSPAMVIPLLRGIRGADLVHIHSVHTFPSTVAMALSRLLRKPYILEPHGALDKYHLQQGAIKKRWYTKTVDRYGWSRVDAAVYSSNREAHEGQLSLSAPPIIMPLGVDENLFALKPTPSEKTASPPQILFLGRLTKKKRVDLVIRALAEEPLASIHAQLTVAGPMGGDLGFRPADLVRELGLEDRVTFEGPVTAAARATLFEKADVFVLPSEDESFGIAIAEAMAAAVPTVATEMTGFAPEAAEEGALKLTVLDAAAISRHIAEAFADRDGYSTRARDYARRHHRWAEAARILARSYADILTAPRRKPDRG